MAPVAFKNPVRYPPLILAASHLFSIVYFMYLVGDSLYTSYRSLGPASNTRHRIGLRKLAVKVFLFQAVMALSVAMLFWKVSMNLSYKTWAYEHGFDLPQRVLWEDEGHIPVGEHSGYPYIIQWLSDTPIYLDTIEIVAEKARRFWWGQQLDVATMAFSLMLATEGRRRRIPLLTAFLALAHLVNLAFALYLFFVALLLTPSPLPSGDADLEFPVVPLPTSIWTRFQNKLIAPKPTGWAPNAMIFYILIAFNLMLTFVLPHTTGSSTFIKAVILTRVSTFLPILLPKLVPARWGSIQQQPHGAYESHTKLFKFMSTGAIILHVKATIVALLSNVPDSHYHRHSAMIPWDLAKRSLWERSTSAIGKVLGSAFDHPAVAAVSFDIAMCALSLGFWAVHRGLDVRDMLSSSALPYNATPSSLKWTSPEKGAIRNDILNFLEPGEAGSNQEQNDEYNNSTALHGRGRITRRHGGSVASSDCASEEAQAIGKSLSRQRGHPKAKKVAEGNMEERLVPRRPGRRSKTSEEAEDKTYTPTPATAQSTLGGDSALSRQVDWESAALAWGLTAFGGLASACAAVFGAECISQ